MEASRIEPVQHRIAVAKAALAIGAAVAFGAALGLSRLHNPGNPKRRPVRHLSPLGVLPSYAATVRKDFGDTGVIAPPQKSPSAATHVS